MTSATGRFGAALIALGALCLSRASTGAELERNVALWKTASQSSTILGGTAGRAVDVRTDGRWSQGSVTHTADETDPYWQVDLGASYRIDEVRVFGRSDCCQERLKNFAVFLVDNTYGFPHRSFADTLDQRGPVNAMAVLSYPTFVPAGIAGPGGATVPGQTVRVDGTRARYVRVQLAGHGTLSLAEVQVIAKSDIPGPAGWADAMDWRGSSVSSPAGAAMIGAGDNLELFVPSANKRLAVSTNFGQPKEFSVGPQMGPEPPAVLRVQFDQALQMGPAAPRNSKVLIAAVRTARSGPLTPSLAILEQSRPFVFQPPSDIWTDHGPASSAPAVASTCGRAFVAWRRNNQILVIEKHGANGSWSAPRSFSGAESAPQLAVNNQGELGLAFVAPYNRVRFVKAFCTPSAMVWRGVEQPPYQSYRGGVSLSAYGRSFLLGAATIGGRPQFGLQVPTVGGDLRWSAAESIGAGSAVGDLAEPPRIVTFSGLIIALLRTPAGELRYWVRVPNRMEDSEWVGGRRLAAGAIVDAGTPLVASVGSSNVAGLVGAPAELYLSTRDRRTGQLYGLNLGRTIAYDIVTKTFGLKPAGQPAKDGLAARFYDFPRAPNLFEHLVALLSLPRQTWVPVMSKPCGGLNLPTRVDVDWDYPGQARAGECPMSISLSGSTGGSAQALHHEWLHLAHAAAGVTALPDYAATFQFKGSGTNPAESGMRACTSSRDCGGAPCEMAGDQKGGTAASTRDYADNEWELRRWDNIRVCVARGGPGGRRYQGGVSWYDVGTADHAFVNTAVLYRWFGEELRAMAAADAADGNLQLQRRYNWLKKHVYQDVEYNGSATDGNALPRSDRNLGAFGRPSR